MPFRTPFRWIGGVKDTVSGCQSLGRPPRSFEAALLHAARAFRPAGLSKAASRASQPVVWTVAAPVAERRGGGAESTVSLVDLSQQLFHLGSREAAHGLAANIA
jgi:hypothetical protein